MHLVFAMMKEQGDVFTLSLVLSRLATYLPDCESKEAPSVRVTKGKHGEWGWRVWGGVTHENL